MNPKINNMKRSITGLIIFSVLLWSFHTGNAVTNNTTTATATATVSETISVTLSGAAITFPNLNAGTNNTSATAPLNISIDPITNVNTNISQNGTNFVSGDYSFLISNLRYSNSSGNGGLVNSTTMSSTFPLPPFSDWSNITKSSEATRYHDSYYWLTIPNGQQAGEYVASIYINVTKA